LIEERKCTSLPCSPARRVSAKKKNFYISQAIRNSDLTPRAKGKKSLRRQENALYLNNLLERDECSKDDLEVCSNPAIPSIFTEACTNGSYVEPWNDFMNCSGEEQERLLSLLEEEGARRKNPGRLPRDGRNGSAAGGALRWLQKRARGFWKRRAVKIHLTACFLSCLCSTSFERLLLHAACQYMDLISASKRNHGRLRRSRFLPLSPPCPPSARRGVKGGLIFLSPSPSRHLPGWMAPD
ncbi:unnamed protein product, partial [Tetraodon nigroviridis]